MVLFFKCQHLERECLNLLCNTGYSAPSNFHPDQAPGETHLQHKQTLPGKSTEMFQRNNDELTGENQNIFEKCKHYIRLGRERTNEVTCDI